MKQRIAVAVIAAVFACSPEHAGSGPDDTNVRVAAFEILFGEQADLRDHLLFLSVGERPKVVDDPASDPDAELLKRLRDRGWAVEPGTHAAPFDMVVGIRDAKSGKRGVWFYVGHIEWTGSNEVTVYGEFWANGKSSEAARYRLLRQAGTWKLISRNSIRKS